jgi:hypothetical protein
VPCRDSEPSEQLSTSTRPSKEGSGESSLALLVLSADSSSLSDTDIIQAERSLYRVRHDLVAKREEMSRVSAQSEPASGGWMGRVFGSKADQGMSDRLNATDEAEVSSLQAELAGLRAMESQVARSISAMKVKKVRGALEG